MSLFKIPKRKNQRKYHPNLKFNIYMGVAATLALNMVNPYFAKFALRLGASDYHIASLSSLPALVSVFTLIPGAILIDFAKSKQKMTARIMLFHKVFYLFLALVPFLNRNIQATVFVLLVGLMNFPFSVYAIGYQSFIGDLFVFSERGNAMSLRNKYGDMARLLITLLTGNLFALLKNHPQQLIFSYQILFVLAFFVSLFEVYYFKKLTLPSYAVSAPQAQKFFTAFLSVLRDVPKNKNFVLFTLCSLTFHFGWQMGWPLFNLYSINYLHADELWLSMLSIVAGIFTVLTVKKWAKFADKKGNTFALFVSTSLMAITPILFAISKSMLQITAFHAIIGTATAGTLLILFNILLEVTPDENRTIYIAIYSTLINISAAIAPIIGVYLKNQYSIYVALIVVAILRTLGSLTFLLRHKKRD